MLALFAWCGQLVRRAPTKRFLKVYTKLGGRLLGSVELRQYSTIQEQVKDLQAQVAWLFGHPVRTSNYLSLYVDGFKLPSFTYTSWISQTSDFVAVQKLGHSKNLECMYDEDDTCAFICLRNTHSMRVRSLASPNGGTTTRVRLVIDWRIANVLVNYTSVLKYTTNPRELYLECCGSSDFPLLDCSVLSGVSSLEVLRIDPKIRVRDWRFAKSLCLKVLEVGASSLESLDFGCLEHLQELFIIAGQQTISIKTFKRLPESLKNVHFVTQPTSYLAD